MKSSENPVARRHGKANDRAAWLADVTSCGNSSAERRATASTPSLFASRGTQLVAAYQLGDYPSRGVHIEAMDDPATLVRSERIC